MSKETSQLQESYLLLEFFENIQKVLSYLNTDRVAFEVRPNRTAKFLKYRIIYQNRDGDDIEELLTHCLRFGAETAPKIFYENFDKVIGVIEKENVTLKPISTDTTLKAFLSQFNKVHEVVYLNRELNNELSVNEGSDDKKRLKL